MIRTCLNPLISCQEFTKSVGTSEVQNVAEIAAEGAKVFFHKLELCNAIGLAVGERDDPVHTAAFDHRTFMCALRRQARMTSKYGRRTENRTRENENAGLKGFE